MTHAKPDRGTIHAGPGDLLVRRAPVERSAGRAIRTARAEQGQAITEFAVVLPLIAGMAFVLIMFGRLLFNYIQLTHAANEGARLAAVNRPASGTLCGVLHSAYTLPSGATVTISYPPSPDDGSTQAVGDPVKVDVSTSTSWVPLIGSAFSGGMMHVSATMRLEQPATSSALAAGSCFT